MLVAFLAGLFGLLIGSFLNVCIYRLPNDLSVVRPRSYCPSCKAGIAWYDNVPVLSYLVLRGRCRKCKARISFHYPLVEFVTGAAFFAAIRIAGPSAKGVKLCVFATILIELVFSDLEFRVLPDEFTYSGILLGLASSVIAHGAVSPFNAAAAAVLAAGALWLVGKLYKTVRHRDGLGLGDVKMVAMIGAFLGVQGVLLTLILGSLLGAVTGLAFIVLAKKDPATYELPFGSFLGIAALAVGLFGGTILAWYSQLAG